MQAIANSKLALQFPVDADSAQPGRVVGELLAARLLHGEQIVVRACSDDLGIAAPVDLELFASAVVMENVSRLIAGGPATFRAGDIGALRQDAEVVPNAVQGSKRLQLSPSPPD